jgi:beta-fructofuranosidase
MAVGEVLDMPLENPLKSLRIFIDHTSTEYFVNDGEATFTTHSYPEAEEFHYTVTDGAKVKIYKLNPSVKDDFVV